MSAEPHTHEGAILTWEIVREIRKRFHPEWNRSQRAEWAARVAKKFGVTKRAINMVIYHKTWRLWNDDGSQNTPPWLEHENRGHRGGLGSILDWNKAREIRRRWLLIKDLKEPERFPYREQWAAEFGVARGTINAVINNKTWKE